MSLRYFKPPPEKLQDIPRPSSPMPNIDSDFTCLDPVNPPETAYEHDDLVTPSPVHKVCDVLNQPGSAFTPAHDAPSAAHPLPFIPTVCSRASLSNSFSISDRRFKNIKNLLASLFRVLSPKTRPLSLRLLFFHQSRLQFLSK